MRVLLYVFFLITFISCNTSGKGRIQLVSQEEVELLLKQDEVQFIDVRTEEEYNAGHIANAQNIDFLSDDFETAIKNLDTTKPVIVYCEKGGRSAKCAKKMEDLGFVKIYDLEGGYSEWEFLKPTVNEN